LTPPATTSRESRATPRHSNRLPVGVGRAIRDGLCAATGDYVLSLDCDFQHLLPEVRDMFDAAAEGYDVAVGSRFSRHSVLLNYPWLKIIANRAFHLLSRLILVARFRDLTNNLKLMRREAVENLILLEPGFAVNAEIGLQLLIAGYRMKEVPVSWIGRGVSMGTSSFRLSKAGGGYWRVLRRIWLRRYSWVSVRIKRLISSPRSAEIIIALQAGRHARFRQLAEISAGPYR
jgi:dolichol-phosphate mannosyltransferase